MNPAPEVEKYHPGPFLAWHRRHFTKDIEGAHEYVRAIIDEDGPYDGVIGFSQGGALAASLILTHQLRQFEHPKPFNFAIFISSVLPVTPSEEIGIDATGYVVGYERSYPGFFGLSEQELEQKVSSTAAHLFAPMDTTTGNESLLASKIDIPTLHILGSKDEFHSFGRHVVDLCEQRKSHVLVHDHGHEVPRLESFIDKATGLIESVIELSKIDY